jgi:hypothetical protein
MLQMQHQFIQNQTQLQATSNQCQYFRGQLETTNRELERERKASEIVNQRSQEREECHCKLQKDYHRVKEENAYLQQSIEDSEALLRETTRRADELSNGFRARAARGEVADPLNGQSLSELVLESAKDSLLVRAMSGQYSEEDLVTRLKNVMEENISFQLRNEDLARQNMTITQELGDGNNEIANLKKVLELTEEDNNQRKKPRRGKPKSLQIE